MKYIPSIAFEEMSGSAKGVTAAKTRGRKYIRNRGYGGSTRTEFQASVKSVFKQLSQSWKALSNAQILAWNKLAQSQAGRSAPEDIFWRTMSYGTGKSMKMSCQGTDRLRA